MIDNPMPGAGRSLMDKAQQRHGAMPGSPSPAAMPAQPQPPSHPMPAADTGGTAGSLISQATPMENQTLKQSVDALNERTPERIQPMVDALVSAGAKVMFAKETASHFQDAARTVQATQDKGQALSHIVLKILSIVHAEVIAKQEGIPPQAKQQFGEAGMFAGPILLAYLSELYEQQGIVQATPEFFGEAVKDFLTGYLRMLNIDQAQIDQLVSQGSQGGQETPPMSGQAAPGAAPPAPAPAMPPQGRPSG